MALHAVENIGDAFKTTRGFLLPFDPRQWLKLAVVVFFIGGGLSLPTTQFDTSGMTAPNGEFDVDIPFEMPVDMLALIGVIVAVAVLLGILFAVIGAIMEFVFIESLRNEAVSIRAYWRSRWRQGLRLFGFRVAIGLPVLLLFGGWVVLVLAPLFTGIQTPSASIAVFLLGIPVLFLAGLLYGLVSGFTTVFVVPLMIQADSGVLAGWRRLWPSIKRDWRQYLVYAILAFILTFAVGLLASLLVGLVAMVLLIPLAIVAGIVFFTISFSSAIGIAIIAVGGMLFVLSMVVIWALVQVPVVAYLRYYALLVLGDIEGDFDIIPDQRQRIRPVETE